MMFPFDLGKPSILKRYRHLNDDFILKCFIEKGKTFELKQEIWQWELFAGKNRCLILEKSIIKHSRVRR